MTDFSSEDLRVTTLGPCQYESPLTFFTNEPGDGGGDYMPDTARVICEVRFDQAPPNPQLAFEAAGARERLFFDPAITRAAIVTCGGLCPGLNNVIRSVYYELTANYGVPEVWGIRFGYQGLNAAAGQPPLRLSADMVEEIHKQGGTILGTSRGHQPIESMIEFLIANEIDILFCVGGDGTQRGAHRLAEEVLRHGHSISVIGIPKTIDNDIPFVEPSFGFNTALEKSVEHITGAHNEARSIPGGVGLVKLMGRHAGFIAAGASLTSSQVNFVLVPEVPCVLDGENGLLAKLQRRLAARSHAVIVAAEGAAQRHVTDDETDCDASGNRALVDIGPFLKRRINEYFAERDVDVSVKYFDPSYHIRSTPANTSDALFCNKLARRAVHASMAGKTDMLIGHANDYFIHVPLPLVAKSSKQLDPGSDLWMGVLAATGQAKW